MAKASECISFKIAKILFLFSSCLFVLRMSACTVFKVRTDSALYVASNEDWSRMKTSAYIWTTKSSLSAYAVSYFGFEKHRGWAQSAMNEHGLMYDSARTPPSRMGFDPSKKTYAGDILQKVMEECRNVPEAIALLREYNWGEHANTVRVHFMLVDKDCRSAIVEWVDGILSVVNSNGDFQVMTNFFVSKDAKPVQCKRFKKCTDAFSSQSINGVSDVRKLLYEVKQKRIVSTVVMKVYNLQTRTLSLTFPRNNDSTVVIDVFDCLRDSLSIINLPALYRGEKRGVDHFALGDTMYFDKYWLRTDVNRRYEFYRTIEHIQDSDGVQYCVMDYYKEGDIQMIGYATSLNKAKLGLLEGEVAFYYRNFRPKAFGLMSGHKKDGCWVFWDIKGAVEKQIEYEKNVVVKKYSTSGD